MNPLSQNNLSHNVCLRDASIDDCELVFRWRNLPFIVQLSTSQTEVAWNEHSHWFESILSSKKTIMKIIEISNKPVGQLRFDYINTDCAEISIYLLQPYTGKGFGVYAIMKGCKELFLDDFKLKSIVAFIRIGNTKSLNAFQKVGFRAASAMFEKYKHSSLLLKREECLSN